MWKRIIDESGRIRIPKAIRDDMGLKPGDVFDAQCDGQKITFTLKAKTSRSRTRSAFHTRKAK